MENIKVCQEEKVDWLIKRNPRRESEEEWLKIAQEEGGMQPSREGEQVWVGERWVERAGVAGRLRQVFKVTWREVNAQGQLLLVPEVEVESYWTSLDGDAAEVIELYKKRGTSEQFHSELKTELGLERLPSGKFATNALVLLLGMVAYNILRVVGQLGLEARVGPRGKVVVRRRLRSVMQDLMYLACRLVWNARRLRLVFGRHSPWFGVWRHVYLRLGVT